MKQWRIRNQQIKHSPEENNCPTSWAEKLEIPPIIATLLWQRGIRSLAEMDKFLSPGLRYLENPKLWPGIYEAADILEKGILKGNTVLVWGDYDVDGVTGSTLMYQVLSFHGVRTRVHLPDRRTEGYGLNIPMLEKMAEEDDPANTILLTVDCGISDVAAIARARELGFTTVISDHHLPPPELPKAHAITNPKIGKNPCSHLAGVGVAFFLMAELNSRLSLHDGKKLDMRKVIDLVGMGTVADMVPLVGQNRILVKNGLLSIADAHRPGLAALKSVSGFSIAAKLNSGQIAYNLAPRINAAGRLGSPQLAHDLLRTDSDEEAMKLARELDTINLTRRSEEEKILMEALEQAENFKDSPSLVLCGRDWHQGVVGIVASHILEKYNRPVLILCADGDQLKGSGRSIEEFDLYSGLKRCSDLLLSFGGHRQAAGLRVNPLNLDNLRERFNNVVREVLGEKPVTPILNIDAELSFEQASDFCVVKGLELLEPFGVGNPQPIFMSPSLLVQKRRLFGHSHQHVSLEVTDLQSGITMQAKAWRLADRIPGSIVGKKIKLAFTPDINNFRGVSSIELNVKDWQLLDA